MQDLINKPNLLCTKGQIELFLAGPSDCKNNSVECCESFASVLTYGCLVIWNAQVYRNAKWKLE